MRRRRDATPEEIALFQETLKIAVQFRNKVPSVRVKPGAAKAKLKSGGAAEPQAYDLAKEFSAGLDGQTASRLLRGALEPHARIDLHGMTEAGAHRALIGFIRGAAARGHKLVLVVTGKGLPPDPYAPFDLELDARRRGVLRMMVPRWLNEPDLSRLVADVRPAHRRHGGEGALYIYLRKP